LRLESFALRVFGFMIDLTGFPFADPFAPPSMLKFDIPFAPVCPCTKSRIRFVGPLPSSLSSTLMLASLPFRSSFFLLVAVHLPYIRPGFTSGFDACPVPPSRDLIYLSTHDNPSPAAHFFRPSRFSLLIRDLNSMHRCLRAGRFLLWPLGVCAQARISFLWVFFSPVHSSVFSQVFLTVGRPSTSPYISRSLDRNSAFLPNPIPISLSALLLAWLPSGLIIGPPRPLGARSDFLLYKNRTFSTISEVQLLPWTLSSPCRCCQAFL